MTETGNPSISRGLAPCFYSKHKYKWAVLLIDRSCINQEPNAGTLLCYDHDLSLIPGIWWYCILDGHPWWIYLQENIIINPLWVSGGEQAQICAEGCEGDNFTQILWKYCEYCTKFLQILYKYFWNIICMLPHSALTWILSWCWEPEWALTSVWTDHPPTVTSTIMSELLFTESKLN